LPRGASMNSRRLRLALAAALAVAGSTLAGPASAFEYFDGKLQVHGFYEAQIRFLGRGFNPADNIDMAQWYNVLNLELELSAIDEGWGPIDLLSFYLRAEARYDCVWTRACGLFPSVNTYGNRAKRLPLRMVDAERSGFQGTVYDGSIGSYSGQTIVSVQDPNTTALKLIPEIHLQDQHLPMLFSQIHRIDTLFEVAGPDQQFGAGEGPYGKDDPAYFYFRQVQDTCLFGSRYVSGGDNGEGLQVLVHNPGCDVVEAGRLRNLPNPFNPNDLNPVTGKGGSAALPFRPAPYFMAMPGPGDAAPRSPSAQGVYYPSSSYRQALIDGLDDPEQNFSQNELAWNRGASQEQTKEIKELYADMEFFESRLWIRLGKQNIVWGKTELFRTTDQFNPQDLALATLPGLEESRIPLWSARGVWSFYTVGPAQDVRAELAFNFDEFQPSDTGRCGEPFTVYAACNKTTGLFFHGITGFGVGGEDRPPDPWESVSGFELGGRVEFRLGRFSFQLSDFWGFDDLPYADQIFEYGRTVDPSTGRPLEAGATGPCATGQEPSCLGVYNPATLTFSDISSDGKTFALDPANQAAALADTPVNLQLFTMICATSIGFNELDTSACAQSIFNSLNNPFTGQPLPRDNAKGDIPTVSSLLSNALAGNGDAGLLLTANTFGVPIPLIGLNEDPCDGYVTQGCPAKGDAPIPDFGPSPFFVSGGPTLNQVLTDEQEALLGCGHFYGTDCEVDGIDLANIEASVFMQSVVGTAGVIAQRGWTTTNGLPQPGTANFKAGPVATRYVQGRGLVRLPGSRGPADAGYDSLVDGTTTGLVIPAQFGASAGQQFATEMAALSFNFQNLAVALSSPVVPSAPQFDEFNPQDPYSTALDPKTGRGQCSFAQPQFCGVISALYDVVGLQRNDVRAGGNSSFGRTDFVWQSGGEVILRYQRRNVLGFAMDFTEDVTKSNWGVEATWITPQQFANSDVVGGESTADTYNLTVSVDRPTFINFLNDQRTFFFNTQWFFQYISGYRHGFLANGPVNVLATFTVMTGYSQDRLQPALTLIYDLRSLSGGALPQITYRFTSNFSASIGLNIFWGRFQNRPVPLTPIANIDNQVGARQYEMGVENGLSLVRERDEAFLKIRYTF
jgi:Protein of unknown function (DUF1302)